MKNTLILIVLFSIYSLSAYSKNQHAYLTDSYVFVKSKYYNDVDSIVILPIHGQEYDNGILIVGTPIYIKRIEEIIDSIKSISRFGKQLIIDVLSQDVPLLIVDPLLFPTLKESDINLHKAEEEYSIIVFDIDFAQTDLYPLNGNGTQSIKGCAPSVLAHEFSHFIHRNSYVSNSVLFKSIRSNYYIPGFSPTEIWAVQAENYIRKAYNLKLRTHYKGIQVFPRKLLQHPKYDNSVYMKETEGTLDESKYVDYELEISKNRANRSCLSQVKYFNHDLVGKGYNTLYRQKKVNQYYYSLKV